MAVGFWNELGEWISDAWDDVSDWWTGDSTSVERRIDDGDLSSTPTDAEIRDNVESLRPFMVEGFRRSEAHRRYGHDILLRHVGSLELIPTGGGYADTEGQKDWKTLNGFYRMSETLGFYMPAAIPDSVASRYPNGEHKQASWVGTTEADDADIDAAAQFSVDTAMSNIMEVYDDLLDQCNIPAFQELLPKLNGIGTAVDELHSRHYNREAQDVLEIFSDWNGEDARAAVEEFGTHLLGALDELRDGVGCLMYSASEEATAQASALFAAYNYVAEAWEFIEDKLNSSSAQEKAVSKFIGTMTVNVIPFASASVATTDFIVEVASNGEVQSPVANFFNGLADRITGKDVPDFDSCQEVVSMLRSHVQEAIEVLKDARTGYLGDTLDTKADLWNNTWARGGVKELIPGYLDD